ncbi:MAG: glycosyltransferase family 4 protein [Carbonactinosporaceae bacterium]
MSERVIYIVRSWPRLSQTFILNEVLALQRRGVELVIYSLARSGEETVQAGVAEVSAPVRYLEDRPGPPWLSSLRLHLGLLAAAPLQYARVVAYCLARPWLAAGYGECTTLQCLSLAARIATDVSTMRSLGTNILHVHAHFAHDPALVGMLTARLSRLPFSFTAHARDLVQIPAAALAARASQARTVVTCCEANAAYITSVVPSRSRPPVLVIHHGVDLSAFVPPPRRATVTVPTVVSVGRLVEKKGYLDLLRALAMVRDTGAAFNCKIFGDGPLRDQLSEVRDSLGLRDLVDLMGPRDNDRIAAELRAADLFVLTPLVTSDGDRDGIPNVLVEAMASGLPVVTTSAGGVTELVRHDTNGLVAAPGDVRRVADLVGALLSDPERRARLGAAARRTVERDFDIDAAARQLEGLLVPRARKLGVSW